MVITQENEKYNIPSNVNLKKYYNIQFITMIIQLINNSTRKKISQR